MNPRRIGEFLSKIRPEGVSRAFFAGVASAIKSWSGYDAPPWLVD